MNNRQSREAADDTERKWSVSEIESATNDSLQGAGTMVKENQSSSHEKIGVEIETDADEAAKRPFPEARPSAPSETETQMQTRTSVLLIGIGLAVLLVALVPLSSYYFIPCGIYWIPRTLNADIFSTGQHHLVHRHPTNCRRIQRPARRKLVRFRIPPDQLLIPTRLWGYVRLLLAQGNSVICHFVLRSGFGRLWECSHVVRPDWGPYNRGNWGCRNLSGRFYGRGG